MPNEIKRHELLFIEHEKDAFYCGFTIILSPSEWPNVRKTRFAGLSIFTRARARLFTLQLADFPTHPGLSARKERRKAKKIGAPPRGLRDTRATYKGKWRTATVSSSLDHVVAASLAII